MARPSAPPITTRATATVRWAPPRTAPTQPATPSATSTTATHDRHAPGGRREQDRQQRQHRADGERQRRGPGRLPGAGEVLGVDGQLGVQVGGERVVFGEFAGDGPGGLRAQALGLVQRGEFGELQLRVLAQFPFLRVELGLLGVALAGHRHVFAEGHRHRAGDQAGDARGEQRAPLGGDPGDADDEPCDRHDAVIGAEHPGAQPVQPRPEAPRRAARRDGGGRRVPARAADRRSPRHWSMAGDSWSPMALGGGS